MNEDVLPRRNARSAVGLAFKVAVTAGIMWLLLRKVDWSGTLAQTAGADLVCLVAAALLIFGQFSIAAMRYLVIARGLGIRLGVLSSFKFVYVGQFFNLVLPSTIGGDAVRGWIMWKSGIDGRATALSIVLDRIAAVLGLILTVIVTQPFMPALAGRGFILGSWAVIAAAIGGIAAAFCVGMIPPRLRRLQAVGLFCQLSSDLRRIFLAPGIAVRSIGFGVLGQLNLSLAMYVLAFGLQIDLGLIDCLVVWPIIVLVTMLPISIAGWGLREGAMVVALGQFGVSADSALILSILIGLINSAVALPGGLVWLAMGSGRPRRVKV